MSAATGLSRVEIYTQHDRPLTPQERTTYRGLIELRVTGTPLQYVTGEMPFRHLVMHVEPGVFIPRPETEVLVDLALAAITEREVPLVIDLCTGSGCIAVSLGFERSDADVWASDASERAVGAARRNALHAGVAGRVQVVHGDLFAPLPPDLRGRVDLVVANPPYVPSADIDTLPPEVAGFEPQLALDGGPDGLDVARRILDEARSWLADGGTVALELDERRVVDAATEAERGFNYVDVQVECDLTDRHRFIIGRKGQAMQS